MSLFEDTNPRALKELLGQIHSGDAVLPDFQRDFVWDPNMTQELIVSIASNYPAGSLLRIRNTHDLFACREFQGAPALNGRKPTYLVLDGQQRLTSLYQAFYGKGDHRFYLNVKRLIAGEDIEDCVSHFKADSKQDSEYEKQDVQARELILPLDVLKGGAGEFSRWMLRVARQAESDAARIRLEDALGEVSEKWIKTVDDYHFPVVTLSDETAAEAVCTIFETLNRTGVKLSPFELLTARFWPKKVNLRQLWAKTKTQYPIVERFDIDPYYVLQIIALASRTTPSCKRGDVLELEADVIEEWWDGASKGLASSLELLRDDCGVMTANWLPYNTIVVPLAAVFAKLGPARNPGAGATRHMLGRWFWCSVFGQTYENAPNSQSAKDVIEILNWVDGRGVPESIAKFAFDPRILRETTYRQRALYRGIICLELRRQPRDFYDGGKLTPERMELHAVDDHHVFPDAYLEQIGVPNRKRDCVLNRTLIDRKTNIRIGKRAPSDYLADIHAALDAAGNVHFTDLLESHLLPAEADSPLLRDDFEAFLTLRQDAVWAELKAATGIGVAVGGR